MFPFGNSTHLDNVKGSLLDTLLWMFLRVGPCFVCSSSRADEDADQCVGDSTQHPANSFQQCRNVQVKAGRKKNESEKKGRFYNGSKMCFANV